MPVPSTPCEIAYARYVGIARWRFLWTLLLFVFGTSVVLFLIGGVLLFITQSWLPAALSTLASLVNGAGAAWVLARRVESVKEEEEAYEDVKQVCGGARPASAADGGMPADLAAVRRKYRLLGLF